MRTTSLAVLPFPTRTAPSLAMNPSSAATATKKDDSPPPLPPPLPPPAVQTVTLDVPARAILPFPPPSSGSGGTHEEVLEGEGAEPGEAAEGRERFRGLSRRRRRRTVFASSSHPPHRHHRSRALQHLPRRGFSPLSPTMPLPLLPPLSPPSTTTPKPFQRRHVDSWGSIDGALGPDNEGSRGGDAGNGSGDGEDVNDEFFEVEGVKDVRGRVLVVSKSCAGAMVHLPPLSSSKKRY